eukprot:TRINITY_DN81974_c0_g1_i1.p1 TRINITY_DN81974_c0_g1~~TRINITY_DN81974_c0_g1_i1.p1  ORF type:complete len:289 (-),score=26.30 TRINITY_DN81974_c0_g1_i1:162-1028(-)
MGRCLRGLETLYRRSKTTYEDVNGLNNTLGIISTLALSFAIAFQYVAVAGQLHPLVDFRFLMCSHPAFREFIVETMERYSGDYKDEVFNFNVPLGKGEKFDVQKELLEGLAHYKGEDGDNDWKACARDPKAAIIVANVLPKFPREALDTWAIWNKVARRSEYIEARGSAAAYLIGSSLMWSLVMSVSLAVSPCREDPSGSALAAWCWVGLPAIAVSYLLLFIGLVVFFVAHVDVLVSTSTFYESSARYVDRLFEYLVYPFVVVGFVLGFVAFFQSMRRADDCTGKAGE